MRSLALLILCACGSPDPQAEPPAPDDEVEATEEADEGEDEARRAGAPYTEGELAAYLGKPIQVEGHAIEYVQGALEVQVRHCRAQLVPNGEVVNFDDPSTFSVKVQDLRVVVAPQQLLAPWMGVDGPLKEAEISVEGDAFVVDAKVTGVKVPVKVKARPRTDEEGRIVLDLEQAKVVGVGVKPLLGLAEKIPKDAPGLLMVDGDVVYIDPAALPGPPAIEVAFDRFEVTDEGLVLEGGEPSADSTEDGQLVLDGGTLQSGRSVLFGQRLDLALAEGGPLRVGSDFGKQMRAGFTKMQEGAAISLRLESPDAVADAEGDPDAE